MAASPSSPDRSRTDLVAELRAAGCVFAEEEAALLAAAAGSQRELSELVGRRVDGAPLEHILGWAEFCGLRIVVEPGVFVPRRRTEFLARCAAEGLAPGAVVVDMCCGSGAVGTVLGQEIAGIELCAADVDPVAVRCARRNIGPLGGRVFAGDLYAPLPGSIAGRVDVLVANAPYVPSHAVAFMPPEARLHEPLVALDGGGDGLDVHRRLAAAAPGWLAPGGRLLMEISESQADTAAGILTEAGFEATVRVSEEHDATVVVGTRPS
ncbi:putative protein N(5)-glutamine methyltransferase [Rhodococcus zopfii]|uniref:putative protein N(5)-glutamine methyltransferase n=1 Tax=Rhodococcus zopfii TaxID=43772 RepID=UPI00111159B9|nr:putative protein N(5)-glutamine methyltransferase [Rhodococcus zopfii]